MSHQPRLRARHLPRYHADLLGLARHLGLGPAAAEDAVQSCLLAALRQLRMGRDISEPRAYLKTALRHACARHLARKGRQVHLEDDMLDVVSGPARQTSDAEAHMLLVEVLTALDALPPEQSVLLLRVAEGETSPRALAREFDLPPGTIMSRLARGRARLREALELDRDDPLL